MTPIETARRMYRSALNRLHDSDILSQSGRDLENSSAILSILGLEVLLKCVLLLNGINWRSGPNKCRGHEYAKLWHLLPLQKRTTIVNAARYRGGGNMDLLDAALIQWEKAFQKGRYAYELQEGRTEEEIRQIGDEWSARGAPIEEAELQYYPGELHALVAGIREEIEPIIGERHSRPI